MFKDYIERLKLSPDKLADFVASVRSWSDFQGWLDQHQYSDINPKPTRVGTVPVSLNLSWRHNVWQGLYKSRDTNIAGRVKPGWEYIVEHRRKVALALTVAVTFMMILLSNIMLHSQQMPEATIPVYLAIYGVMTWFMASNFFKLVLGTWHAIRGPKGNPWHPSNFAREPKLGTKCAIVFPVYCEDSARVASGMAATWQSIVRDFPQYSHHFDNFLLSDSQKLEYALTEEMVIHRLRDQLPDGRFFYRRRANNSNAKLGNLTDFCRRWGKQYEYMLVMDADSVMDGQTIIALLRMMEGNPRIGILQTNPKPVLRASLFGRMQQFAARLYGSVFSYSLQAMYMGHASYIGHNAMIRVAPFIEHCMLPTLKGPAPWGGKPLSHDIVESAMMARAGYEVWFLPELDGSFEELPANIMGFLSRERRWMQGNLQHLRFLFLNGLRPVHRETFLNGSMGYVAAPLWALFLVVSAYGLVHFLKSGAIMMSGVRSMQMPMMLLLVSSMVFLFLPRLLGLAMYISREKAKGFGGKDKLAWSLLLETIFSFFFSPLMMINVTRFVWLWVKRKAISWDTQQRDDEPLSWKVCFRYFGWISLLGVVCAAVMAYQIESISEAHSAVMSALSGHLVSPSGIVVWFFPILGGFIASVWIARFTSRSMPFVRSRSLFCTPEELSPPQVLVDTVRWNAMLSAYLPNISQPSAAIAFAVRDLDFYLRHRPQTRYRQHVADRLLPLIERGQSLNPKDMRLAIGERRCFDALHIQSQF